MSLPKHILDQVDLTTFPLPVLEHGVVQNVFEVHVDDDWFACAERTHLQHIKVSEFPYLDPDMVDDLMDGGPDIKLFLFRCGYGCYACGYTNPSMYCTYHTRTHEMFFFPGEEDEEFDGPTQQLLKKSIYMAKTK